jgi:hypothetical protein
MGKIAHNIIMAICIELYEKLFDCCIPNTIGWLLMDRAGKLDGKRESDRERERERKSEISKCGARWGGNWLQKFCVLC